MRHCESCDCQLPDESRSCPHCDRPLGEPSLDDESLVLIASLDAFESRRLLDRLTEAEIPFLVLSDADARRRVQGGARGFAGVNVFVPAEQRTRAREIQQEVLRESLPDLPEDFVPPPDGAETCPACATPLAQDAEQCAECGLEFPSADA